MIDSLLLRKDLTTDEKYLLWYFRTRQPGFQYNNKRIGTDIGWSHQRVARIKRQLQDKFFIKVTVTFLPGPKKGQIKGRRTYIIAYLEPNQELALEAVQPKVRAPLPSVIDNFSDLVFQPSPGGLLDETTGPGRVLAESKGAPTNKVINFLTGSHASEEDEWLNEIAGASAKPETEPDSGRNELHNATPRTPAPPRQALLDINDGTADSDVSDWLSQELK